MAENSKKLDLSQPVADLAKDDPHLSSLLVEMGFSELPEHKTLAELASEEGISASIIAFSLEAAGYDLGGYVAPSDGFNSPLPQVFDALFAKRDPQVDAAVAASGAPMMAHMEAAVNRAQKDGILPSDVHSAND